MLKMNPLYRILRYKQMGWIERWVVREMLITRKLYEPTYKRWR